MWLLMVCPFKELPTAWAWADSARRESMADSAPAPVREAVLAPAVGVVDVVDSVGAADAAAEGAASVDAVADAVIALPSTDNMPALAIGAALNPLIPAPSRSR